jgi:hypothetical protein
MLTNESNIVLRSDEPEHVRALRVDQAVQRIMAAVVVADATTLHQLGGVWQEHSRRYREMKARIWSGYVTAAGYGWRDVFNLGEQVDAIVRDLPNGCWGAARATAEAVKAVHMAAHCTPIDLDVYTQPWRTVMGQH